MIGHNMIFKQGLEILLSPAAKQESIDFGAKFLESGVRWSKESSAFVMGCIIQTIEKTSFREPQFECAKVRRKEIEQIGHRKWWNKNLVDRMDDAICCELDHTVREYTQ